MEDGFQTWVHIGMFFVAMLVLFISMVFDSD